MEFPYRNYDHGTFYTWAPINNANYNLDKFDSVTFSSSGITHWDLNPEGNTIKAILPLKDLGVIMSNDASMQPLYKSINPTCVGVLLSKKH